MTELLTCFALTYTVQTIRNPRGTEISSSLNYCQYSNYIIVSNNVSEYKISLCGFRFFWDTLYIGIVRNISIFESACKVLQHFAQIKNCKNLNWRCQ